MAGSRGGVCPGENLEPDWNGNEQLVVGYVDKSGLPLKASSTAWIISSWWQHREMYDVKEGSNLPVQSESVVELYPTSSQNGPLPHCRAQATVSVSMVTGVHPTIARHCAKPAHFWVPPIPVGYAQDTSPSQWDPVPFTGRVREALHSIPPIMNWKNDLV